MRLFPPPLNIDDTEGFTPEKDIFGRQQLGQGLTNLITKVSDPLVVAVDGQWGSGKTTFLKMWAGELRKAGFGVIYFDAFENDYAEDAFTAIVGEIVALAQAKHKENTSEAKVFVQKAVGAGKVLLRSSLKVGVKLATMGVLEAVDFEKADDIAKEAGELTDKYLGELLTKQQQQKDAIQAFRNALTELPALLADKNKPLVIIIDELDRCRPLFALQLLERIKHFFAVPNVHFILGVHLQQFRNFVLAAYGPAIDAQTYLQKFIQITVHLVDDAQSRQQRTVIKFIDYLVREMQLGNRQTVDVANVYFRHIAEHDDLSLRAIEQIMTAFALALASMTEYSFVPPVVIAGLCVLKIKYPDIYVKAKAGRLTWVEARQPLGFNFPPDDQDKSGIELMAAIWEFFTAPKPPDDSPIHKMFRSATFQHPIERMKVVPFAVTNIIDRLTINPESAHT